MKLLCAVQNFRQGWGGVPEAARLFARVLAPSGASVDVVDLGRLHRCVEDLELLPGLDAIADQFDPSGVRDYDALLIMGPWQNPRRVAELLAVRSTSQPLVYLPRGGLARIEFSRLRDLRKWPYLALIERRIIKAARAVVYSSECEKRHTVRLGRNPPDELVIPDFFAASGATSAMDSGDGELRFGFLAEISPRKGLVPLIEAFALFARTVGGKRRLRLRVGGSVRKGCEAYEARARELALRVPANAQVEFLGPVDHERRTGFYAETDVMLVPSLFESYGLTVLEGLAAGCAVVAGPQIGALEYLPAHDRLAVARSTEPADLADALTSQAHTLGPERREGTTAFAVEAIDALNRLALDRWSELLRR